jgi:hypothetical protein
MYFKLSIPGKLLLKKARKMRKCDKIVRFSRRVPFGTIHL